MAEFLGNELNRIGLAPTLHHTGNIQGERRACAPPVAESQLE
jgi:hypothetical protein